MTGSALYEFLATQPLLAMTMLAILAGTLGWRLQYSSPRAAAAMRNTAYLAMVAAILIIVAQLTMNANHSDAALTIQREPQISVRGRETVIPMQEDGHFWVTAEINGHKQDLMIDTGASFISLTSAAAEAAGIEPLPDHRPVTLSTAAGTMTARLGRADTIRFGSIDVSSAAVVIVPRGAGDTNVIGMNLLSSLKSWRVEDRKLVLVP